MFTDIVGYNSFVCQSELDPVELLNHNSKVHNHLIDLFSGNKLQEIGDGTLATFDNVNDAAECAIAIQQYITYQNKYKLRISLHIGDVLACSNDALGNSVCISARIQGAAKPETIAVSKVLYESIYNQIEYNFKSLGAVHLKGIPEPYTLYELLYTPFSKSRLNHIPLNHGAMNMQTYPSLVS